jgi:hypothetical protein
MVGRSADLLFNPVAADFRAAGFDVPTTGLHSTLVGFSMTALRESDCLYIMPETLIGREPGILARRLAPRPWLTPLAIFTRRGSGSKSGLAPLVREIMAAYGAGA